MTRHAGRLHGRPGTWSSRVAAVVLLLGLGAAGPTVAAAHHAHLAKSQVSATQVVHPRAKKVAHVKSRVSGTIARPVHSDAVEAAIENELSLSDEFDRAELVERMLAECRGIPYNAYELVQSTGEALRLPAPIQLMTVRVRHPYCAELLRIYAPKSRV